MPSLLQFVGSIAASPTVRLDLNDGTTWKMLEGTEFPPPPMVHAFASTLLVDGAVNPASKYGLRTLTLSLGIEASTADGAATALQSLFRELDRPSNILRWQPQGVTNPVFFRTFRTSAESVMRYGQPDNRRKTVSIQIDAEFAAYGLLETPVSGVTVNADPAAVSNGCFVDVTGVKGDVESPALIEWPVGGTNQDRQSLFAVRRRGTPASAPFLIQAESMTQGMDTTVQANDTVFSGAGSNYSRCTFATATMQTRLSVTTVGTSGVDLRGRYQVFLRYRKNTALDAINLQLQFGDATGLVVVTNDVFTPANSTEIRFADLGEISIPVGLDPAHDRAGNELSVSNSFLLRVQAERTSGSGTLDLDCLLLVPSDDRTGIVEWSLFAAGEHWVLDATDNNPYHRDSSDRVLSAAAPAVSGGFPMLTPNQSNRIYMLYQVSSSYLHVLSHTDTVSVSYMPRYLSVRPAST